MKRGFAESTIDATVWLMCFHPERLDVWLADHHPGDVLYEVARGELKKPENIARWPAKRKVKS